MLQRLAIALFAALLAGPAGNARATETYHTCTGFIASVPATISTQGVWCLRQDLATGIASGVAITIAANNVTIDCNHFKLGGLAAGAASQAIGIHALNRQNATVRNCNVRGFLMGISLNGGAGHLVEGNRLDNNLHIGIHASGDSGEVRSNLVYDTGGTPKSGVVLGPSTIVTPVEMAIATHGMHVTQNGVDGMFGPGATTYGVYGIWAAGFGIEVRDNRVRNLSTASTSGGLAGIVANNTAMVRTNSMTRTGSIPAGVSDWGIWATSSSRCSGNFISGFTTPIEGCPAL